MEEDQKEKQIPVFTVWKNNVILKNIFLINSPPSPNQFEQKTHHQNHEISKTHHQNHGIFKTHQNFEETLVIGRHPDCDIRLEHPSISRFHLRLHSLPSSKLLFLTDLSSVHGTWVSGKRIIPDVKTRLNEDDTLRIGGSSRVYKLNWIPLSQAYDVSNPFVPPLDFVEPQEDEEEVIVEDESSVGLENEEVQAVDSVSKGLQCSNHCDDYDDKLVVEQVASKTEEVVGVENECVELEGLYEGLISLFLDEKAEEFVQEEMPPDPPTQFVNSEYVVDDSEQPMDSVLDGLVPLFLGENWEWVGHEHDGNYVACPTKEEYPESVKHKDMGSLDSVFIEGLETSLLDENSEQQVQKVIASELTLPDMTVLMTPNLNKIAAGETGNASVSESIQNVNEVPLQEEDIVEVIQSASPSKPEDMAFHVTTNLGNTAAREEGSDSASEIIQNKREIPLPEEDTQDDAWSFWCGSPVVPTSSLLNKEDLCTEFSDLDIENQYPKNKSEPRVSVERKCLDSANTYQNSSVKDHNGNNLWSFWSGNMGIESSVCSSMSEAGFFSEIENKSLGSSCQSPPLSFIKKPWGSPLMTSDQKSMSSIWSRGDEPQSADAGFFSETENKSLGSCCQSPPLSSIKRPFEKPLVTSDQKSASSIWSRRGKLQSAPQILTSQSEGKKMRSDQKKVKHEPLSRALFHVEDDQEEDEVFTPGKENYTPKTHRSMRKLAMLQEAKNSGSAKSPLLKMIGCPKVYYEDIMSPSSDKENYSPRTNLKEKTARRASVNQVKSARSKERKGERNRMPFQTLFCNSPQKCTSETRLPDAATRNQSSDNCAEVTHKTHVPNKGFGMKNQKWNMLVDTTTLLNKESRKALQLLEGLKGTKLIIPKIVIKDLACLKRQTSFFRRNTEVSSALEWIEDCMLKAQWWIHVQNSVEEERPVASTPPASPYSQMSFGTTTGSFTFSTLQSQPELLSPTVDDHVLDYAISFKKNKTDGQLVLISNDVTLKIKAMAEGIICETAEEFRESLMNPFSERFLWADSCPIGQTWSCSDDIVLRKKFYPSSLKMTPKAMEHVKGLKLILLHNSQYFEQRTAIH